MIKLIKEKIKNNNGFTGQDIIIAIFIILLFLSLITTLLINLSNTSSEISKVKILTETLTKVADKIDGLNYDEIDVTTEEKSITDLSVFSDLKLNNNMKITYTVEEDETQTVKSIKLMVKYPNVEDVDITIGKRIVSESGSEGNNPSEGGSSSTQAISINTDAQYPFNRPNHTLENASLSYYQYGEGKPLFPIKFVWTEVTTSQKEGAWVITTESDLEWYSLEENIWPTFAYQTADRAKRGIAGYTNNEEYPSSSVLKYNPFTNNKGKSDSKYAFIWLPRVLKKSSSQDYYYGYEKSNNKIIYDNNDILGYIADTSQELNPYNTNLYSNNNNNTTKYIRGTLIAYESIYNSSWWNSAWNTIIDSAPTELSNKIKGINMHTNEYVKGL